MYLTGYSARIQERNQPELCSRRKINPPRLSLKLTQRYSEIARYQPIDLAETQQSNCNTKLN